MTTATIVVRRSSIVATDRMTTTSEEAVAMIAMILVKSYESIRGNARVNENPTVGPSRRPVGDIIGDIRI